MPNPMFSNRTSPNGVTAPENNLNDSYKRYRRGYNKFDLSRSLYTTERFADINLIECLEGVEGDKLTFGNKHEIRTYTMNSPVMFDLYKKKTFFMVDNKAILPINWEKVYKQPNKGDDVADNVNCVVNNFLSLFHDGFEGLQFSSSWTSSFGYLTRFVLLLESVFSDGSLLANMNCHLSNRVVSSDTNSTVTLESVLHSFYNRLYTPDLAVKFPSLSTSFVPVTNFTKQQFIDYLRIFPDFEFNIIGESGSFSTILADLLSYVKKLDIFPYSLDISEIDDTFNFSRLVAYQLVCTQFYSRDSVDNIYNAELFMQNAKEVATTSLGSNWPRFIYNGVKTDYDVFSGKIIGDVLSSFLRYSHILDDTRMLASYNFLHMLFFYRKSLRYGDYFVGGKTLPFAPGDVVADVVNGGVSALDMTRKILMQRFLNSVERVSNTWKDYLSGVTDGVAPPNPCEPRFLASSTSLVSGFEVENTAENQGNIVTLLKSQNSNYVYELEVGSPCIVIGVSTYEIQRVYSRTIDRFFKHRDRFDMFNKFMQNIGDQEIYAGERNAILSWNTSFAYTPRHMEYKQRYPIAAGGFVSDSVLSKYAFVTDNGEANNVYDDTIKISPFYLRNQNVEFDRFFKSLTGVTLASYFHFEVKYNCICHAVRQMEYSPSIL